MGMGTQQNNTMQEQLPKLRKIISDMKVVAASDGDLEWLINLETQVLMKEREPMDAAMNNMQQQGLTQAPVLPPGSMGGMGMGTPPGGGASFQGEGPGMGGMRVPPPQVPGEELQRLIQAPPQ